MNRRTLIGSLVILGAVIGVGAGLATWKFFSIRAAIAASENHPEQIESVTVALVKQREHRRTTTSIGTVIAMRSITLRNELAGTVHQAMLTPGLVVNAGDVLVTLDVSVEEAELKAQEAQAAMAETVFARTMRLSEKNAVSEEDVDRARAARDVAAAQVARTKAVIAKKTIRAPFRARVGLADVHPGQYLNEGTQLTTLQGIDDEVHVDFTVAQRVAAVLRTGDIVEVFAGSETPIEAKIVALDARIDRMTRNAMVRAVMTDDGQGPAPGASVRVRVPVGPPIQAAVIPVSALRKGPGGDHVFIVAPDKNGKTRAQERPVESGTMLGDEVLVYKGLETGEQVAASGSFKLRDGILVAIVTESASKGAAAPK